MTTIYYSDIDHKDVKKAMDAMSTGIDVFHDKAIVPYKSSKLSHIPNLASFLAGAAWLIGPSIVLPGLSYEGELAFIWLMLCIPAVYLIGFPLMGIQESDGVIEYQNKNSQPVFAKVKYRGLYEYLIKKRKFKKNAEKMYPLDNSLSGLSQVLQDIETVSALSNKMEDLVKEYGQESVYIKSSKEEDGSLGITLVVNDIKNGMMAYVDENAYNCTISDRLYNEIFHDDVIDFRVAERKARHFKEEMLAVKSSLELPANASEVILGLPGEFKNETNDERESESNDYLV